MKTLVPVCGKKVFTFAHLSYDDAIDRFGIDKPDIRSSLEILNITNTGLAKAIESPEFPIFEMADIHNDKEMRTEFEFVLNSLLHLEILSKKLAYSSNLFLKY